ncbi:MAG: TIM-barrel domain-containing protein [Pseudomonadota bacterium]
MSAFEPVKRSWFDLPTINLTSDGRHIDAHQIEFETSAGPLLLTLYEFGVRIRMGGPRAIDYGLVNENSPPAVAGIKADDETVVVESASHRLVIERETLAFDLSKTGHSKVRSARDGHFVRKFRLPPIAQNDRGWVVHLDLHSRERIYGLGEKWGKLDRRGQFLQSYNRDALGVNAEASYKNAPFAWSSAGWGVFVNTPSPLQHGVGFAPWSQRTFGLCVEDPHLDLFLFTGDTGEELIRDYTRLTGRAPIPPDWSFGLIMSKAYYQDADELLSTAREIRQRGLPCDTITLDGRAWLDVETRFSFEWDKTRYPNPGRVIDELKSLDFRICVWEYPYISTKNKWFEEWSDREWLLKEASTNDTHILQWDAEPFDDVLTPLPASGIVDFTHPLAYEAWRDAHQSLFELGVDMIKADFGEQVADHTVAHNGETGRSLHNVYAYLYNKCVYEAAEKYSQSGPFLFSRASWTGCQKFPSQWGGDPQADWEGLAASIRGGLSWGLTGAPFYATDVGGFYGDQRDPKLYVRWLQAAIFSAHMRLHGIGQREPWTYGPQAEQAANEAIELRYRLLPYIKKAAIVASETGMPVQRAMPLACPNEPEAWHFDEQFFFGSDIFVAPCVHSDDTVAFYLPKGRWSHLTTGEPIEGGEVHAIKLELTEIAAYVREGTEIPMGPVRQHIDQIELSN